MFKAWLPIIAIGLVAGSVLTLGVYLIFGLEPARFFAKVFAGPISIFVAVPTYFLLLTRERRNTK
jgi:hypothetical protein